MPIRLPQVDYGPLYRAIGLRTGAKTSLLGAQSLEVVSRIRKLESQARREETVLGIAQLLLQFGQTVYGIFEQKQFEGAKADLHDLRQEMTGKIQTYIDNNQMSWTTDAEGNKIMEMPPEFEEWYQQSLTQVEEKYKGFDRVRSWTKDKLYEMYDQSTETALNYGRKYAMDQTLTEFNRNVTNAMTDAVNDRDFASVEAVIGSARNWLGDPQADNLLAGKREEFQFRIHDTEVRAMAATEGYGAAVEHAQGLDLSAEQTQALLASAHDASVVGEKAIVDRAESVYRERLQQGGSPSHVISEILESLPEWVRDEAEDRLRGIQAQIVADQTLKEFTGVRDDLPGLRKLYETVKEDATGRYEGIPAQHENDLRMIEARLVQEENRQAALSPSDKEMEKQAHREWVAIRAMMDLPSDKGGITWYQAWRMVGDRIFKFSPSVAWGAYEELRNFMPEQVKPFVKSFLSDTEALLRQWWGVKPSKELSPQQREEIALAQGYVYGALVDAIRRKPDISPVELRQEIMEPMALLYSKGLDVLHGPAVEQPFRPADRTLAEMQAIIESENLGGLMYQDPLTGRMTYAPGLEGALSQLYSRQQEMVAEELGIPFGQVGVKQAPELEGGVGLLRHYMAGGREYRFFIPDPAKPQMELYVWDGSAGIWMPVRPAKAPVQALPGEKMVPEEYKKVLRELGVVVPAAPAPVFRPGMTREETEEAARKIPGVSIPRRK